MIGLMVRFLLLLVLGLLLRRSGVLAAKVAVFVGLSLLVRLGYTKGIAKSGLQPVK